MVHLVANTTSIQPGVISAAPHFLLPFLSPLSFHHSFKSDRNHPLLCPLNQPPTPSNYFQLRCSWNLCLLIIPHPLVQVSTTSGLDEHIFPLTSLHLLVGLLFSNLNLIMHFPAWNFSVASCHFGAQIQIFKHCIWDTPRSDTCLFFHLVFSHLYITPGLGLCSANTCFLCSPRASSCHFHQQLKTQLQHKDPQEAFSRSPYPCPQSRVSYPSFWVLPCISPWGINDIVLVIVLGCVPTGQDWEPLRGWDSIFVLVSSLLWTEPVP